MSYLKHELEFSYSILQGEAVFKIFEIADNNLMTWILITETYPQTLLVCQWYVCRPQHPAARSPVGRMTSLLHGGHVRLGVNFMSWSNFWVLVWLSLPWRDFITLSDIIRIYGHVMSDVIPLWWSRESWYDFFSVLDEIFVLVGFCLSWCHYTPWYNQPNLGMIFLRFGYNFRFSAILFLLVSLDILVWLTASWYDFLHFARLFCLSVILFDLV